MSKDMMRRLAAIEAGKVELPPEVRLWLGETITDEERASIVPQPPRSNEEDAAAIRALPADMRAWFESRVVTNTI
ncbi:hypothetical protein E2E30_08995 [Sphingomonas sp. AAP5]|uniref:hypothetical protein n=1 Tax=Sphingomonas sp. AAP5 TaxID=1523415 RepID=UPI001056EA5F|nr:hypothetical protein [Sphingomonas sp. AAP5]QBM75893.1 hypothetical protein E2E30_08995 [Sphingomonas sp. AAP5]